MATDTPSAPDDDRRRAPRSRALRRGGRRITDLYAHPDAYLTINEFADHLRVDKKTVHKWIAAGLLTAYQFQGKSQGMWRIRKVDAVMFVERSRVRPTETTWSAPGD